jgi:hypothetical protein
VTYTHPLTRALYALICGMFAAFAGFGVLGLFAVLDQVGAGVVALVLVTAFGGWRGATVRVEETGEGLVVRNPLVTHVVAWADVERVVDVAAPEMRGMTCPGLRQPGRRKPLPLVAMLYWETPFGGQPTRSAERFADAVKRWNRTHGTAARHAR